jgi:hypothetical protein
MHSTDASDCFCCVDCFYHIAYTLLALQLQFTLLHIHCIHARQLLQARRIDQLETRLRLLFKHEAEALSGYVQYMVTVAADTAGARDALHIRCFDPVSLSHYSLKLPENLNGQKGGFNLTKLAPGQVHAAVLLLLLVSQIELA